MPVGRRCVEHYRSLNRYCVFSHDEMVCNIAAKANGLDLELATAIQKDMTVMIQEEKELRERAYRLVSDVTPSSVPPKVMKLSTGRSISSKNVQPFIKDVPSATKMYTHTHTLTNGGKKGPPMLFTFFYCVL